MHHDRLKRHGYETATRPRAGGGGGGGGGGSGGAGAMPWANKAAARAAALPAAQKREVLQRLRLLITGVPLLGSATAMDGAANGGSDPMQANGGGSGGGADDGLDAAACAAAVAPDWLAAVGLPSRLPEHSYGAAWQLPRSVFAHLPAVSVLLAAVPTIGSTALAKKPPSTAAAAPADAAMTVMRIKRARVLRDGELTLIPYGHDESQLWLQRVHTFIGATRCATNSGPPLCMQGHDAAGGVCAQQSSACRAT